MFRRLALPLLLVLAAAGPALGSGPYPAARIVVLVDGRPLPQYLHRGTLYIEASRGREYEIRLDNPFPVRVAVALAVDGLNTIDARHTSAREARKWVIEPYGSITISGWQTSMSEARRFHFTTEERSYAQWLGKTADLGVISAVFFRERIVHPVAVPPLERPRAEGQPRGAGEGAAAAPAGQAPAARADASAFGGASDYAATGIGRATEHEVRVVHMDLEDAPAAFVDIRYEYRPQLVRLGVLPAETALPDPLARREKARGFEGPFCPAPKREW
jgi:hypothetical protein